MKLHAHREKNGLTYTALAEMLGLTASHVRKLCLGDVRPTLNTIRKIEAATKRAVRVGDWV